LFGEKEALQSVDFDWTINANGQLFASPLVLLAWLLPQMRLRDPD
jgi:hypothetical protein